MTYPDLNEIAERVYTQPHAIALGPSVLESVASGELVLLGGVRFAVPDILLQLLSRVNRRDRKAALVLSSVFRHFGARNSNSANSKRQDVFSAAKELNRVLKSLRRGGKLEVIASAEADIEFQATLRQLYEQPRFQIELSPKSSFLKQYVVDIFSWAKERHRVVLEKGRRTFSDIRPYVSLLELPERADTLIRLKADYFENRLRFRGYRATKFFLAVSIGIAGLAHPGFGVAGLLIAFVDP